MDFENSLNLSIVSKICEFITTNLMFEFLPNLKSLINNKIILKKQNECYLKQIKNCINILEKLNNENNNLINNINLEKIEHLQQNILLQKNNNNNENIEAVNHDEYNNEMFYENGVEEEEIDENDDEFDFAEMNEKIN